MRGVALKDRAMHDKGQRGFVSWLRAYTKHQASSIFRVSDLDWEDLGKAWGLLKLPKMPELKKWEGDRSLGLRVDFQNYEYKDKKREAMRKEQLLQKRHTEVHKLGSDNNSKKAVKRSWSQKSDQKDERQRRREQKHAKREAERWKKMTPAEREKQLKLERMIEDVKRRKIEEDKLGEFHGFDD
ncbi:MAG: hypothetical protein LQ341_006045 [Variospora aurantia]|nr:MAG: hypothetical protein LQ341_006045 [Variospora aurantia]